MGVEHGCALTVSGELRCWGGGGVPDISSLPPGAVTAVEFSSGCALLADGSVYCPDRSFLVPPELAPGDVVMGVSPRRLNFGERAAIRFADLRETTAAFTARIEVIGDGTEDVSSYYRLFDSNGQPLEAGNSVQFTGNPPMVWLEATAAGRGSRLYVRPLELLPASGSPPSIRMVAHPVELIAGPFLTASTATVTEGAAAVELSILLPLADEGLPVELELTVSGTALAGADYTLAPAPGQGIVFAGEKNSTITLSVESAPAERLRLLLQIRADDRIVQGTRFLNLRLSGYSVMPESGEPAELPRALNIALLDDEPLTVQQLQVGKNGDFACVLLSGGVVRCTGNDAHGRATPPADLGPVAQLGVGIDFACALTVSGELRCWGSDAGGRSSPPQVLGSVAQLTVADRRSCALTVAGALHCWGLHNDLLTVARALPPSDLSPVVQVAVGAFHSCAVTVSGKVRCWGSTGLSQSSPPDDLGPVAQVAVGRVHSCALTISGELHCWGDGASTPPHDLDPFVQLAAGRDHNCALTVGGRVRCWGDNDLGQSTPPDDLGPVAQLSVGESHACVLTVSQGLRCWGNVADKISSLPPGAVTAVEISGRCALLADGSVVCPDNPQLVPPELAAGDVVMAVWPQRLNPGEQAAIRFADLRETTTAFTARIEILGGGAADVSSYYRLLSSTGTVLVAAGDANSVLLTGNPPMAWLEASGVSRFSRLYVRPIELLSASDSTPSIRVVQQLIELIDRLSFTASTDTLTEGGEAAQLSIVLPAAHAGLPLELELAVSGNALAGSDYTLAPAPGQGIVLGGEATDEITLRVESAPAEPLRLLLRQRAADSIYQGQRSLTLQISRYQVVPEGEATVDLPPTLDFTLLDDEPPTVQQLQVGKNRDFACVLLSDRSVRCTGSDTHGRATPPEDLGPVAQLGVGELHACALTVGGEVHCWGYDEGGQSSPPEDLDPVAQLVVADRHSCALTVFDALHCWGLHNSGLGQPRALPPEDIGRIAQVAVGADHSCALTIFGLLFCWGRDDHGQSSDSPRDLLRGAQLAVGDFHSCLLTRSGEVHCWGLYENVPNDLGPVVQLGVGAEHTCALTVGGQLRCWGDNNFGQSSPPDDLAPAVQLSVGASHSCALTVSQGLRCWGNVLEILSLLPPGAVTAVDFEGTCALLAEGSMVCPDRSQLVPPELAASDVVMGVSPQRLNPGERAAIRFLDLRKTTETFTVRIEVIGDGAADVSSYYRLLSSTGTLLVAEPGANSVLLTGDPPMAWLEYLGTASLSRLYVLPLELLSAAGSTSSIRVLAQPVELVAAPFLSVSSDTLTEGGEGIQLSIWLPQEHIGLPLELELAVGGTVLAGSDFTLVAAASPPRITLAGEANSTITLSVESAPAEPLRLLLRQRADDSISQGDRLLTLRLSRYQVTPEAEATVDLPPALDITIVDDEPPTAQQIVGATNGSFVCVLLNGGGVRCAGRNDAGQSTPPNDLEPVVQLVLGALHACALTVSGQVRCWGNDTQGRSTPPDGLGPVAQLGVGDLHSCALTVSGHVRCWGSSLDERASPSPGLGPDGGLGAVVQLGVGRDHTCALTVGGEVRCWGNNFDMRATPPDNLGPVAQIGVGDAHSCALTVAGQVRCWGVDEAGQSSPPEDLGAVVQLSVGGNRSCALTIFGRMRCWGSLDTELSSALPPGAVTAVAASGVCALLADGSVYCPDNPELVPAGLAPSEVVMVVSPRQLQPGQRAAIRFADLRDTPQEFIARIEVFGEGAADVSSAYRLLNSDGQPLEAMQNANSPLIAGNSVQLTRNSPMVWLEATGTNRSLRLYVRPFELQTEGGRAPSIRVVAQSVELVDGLFLRASTNTSTSAEGDEDVQINIWLPLAHVGLPVELELAVIGSARAGTDYTLVAAAMPGFTFGTEQNSPITLRVESAPATEPLRLLLKIRADDGVIQGDRSLQLRISSYRVTPETGAPVALPPPLALTIVDDDLLTVQQILLGRNNAFACVLLAGGALRCGGDNTDNRAMPPGTLGPDGGHGPVAQLGVGMTHSCALTVSGRVRCWGSNDNSRVSLRPADNLGPFVQLAVGQDHSCALTELGAVHCWGYNGPDSDREPAASGRATPPDDLDPVAYVGAGNVHSCALTVAGAVRCWGGSQNDRTTPPVDGPFIQLVVADSHNCALDDSGEVHCWGWHGNTGRTTPPGDLDTAVQLVAGSWHTCALTVLGAVGCWGDSERTTLPAGLGPGGALGRVVELSVGRLQTCALTVLGQRHCWGNLADISSLPSGSVETFEHGSGCALLLDGSVYCGSGRQQLLPSELRASDVLMLLSPQQLQPGERAAIRFATVLGGTTRAFTARITVSGDGSAEFGSGSTYRLLDSDGQPLAAEQDGSYLVGMLRGGGESPPMAWLEALLDGQGSRLYVQPIELLRESGAAPSIRSVAQPIELLALSAGPYLTASTDMLTEGGAAAQLSIALPAAHAGLQLELELAVSGNALAGTDYTLVAANSAPGIVLAGEANSIITLRVASAPAEPLGLLLRPRADNRISEGIRFLNLRIIRYQVSLEGGETTATVALSPALDFTIRDDEPLSVLQIQAERNGSFACMLLSNGTVRCLLTNGNSQAALPADLGAVTQLSRGSSHSCAVTVAGTVRCWGSNTYGRATPPPDLAGVVQLVGNFDHSCAITAAGEVVCWGRDGNNQASPDSLGPNGALGPVAQVGVGQFHSCALTVAGRVHCWGFDGQGRINPPDGLVTQLAVGHEHACAVTAVGEVKCWGAGNARTTVPGDLGPATHVGVGDDHSCARTVAGRVRCWGSNAQGRRSPPGDLGVVTQLAVGWAHNCALMVSGRLRCWGKLALGSMPRGPIMAVDASGRCALLADGSAACPQSFKFVPPELGPSEVAMAVLPRQLNLGQRAAIHFTVLGNGSGALAARIEIFGDGAADVSSYYRLLNSAGQPLDTEQGANSVLLTGDPPMVWLEALPAGRGSRLYVRPSELQSEFGSILSIRMVAQPVELLERLLFTASADALSEGGEEAQLSILLPLGYAGLRVELVLAADGSALAGSDYTLVAADPAQGISLSGGATGDITLRMESAPAEALRLLLRPRGADSIGQGPRLLNLRISRYQVVSASTETLDLPAALDFSIADDDLLSAQQLQLGPDGDFACVRLNDGSVSCVGDNTNGRATPPDDLGGVTQLAVGMSHSCAVTVAGPVRCWGANGSEQATPPVGLDQVVHVAVGGSHSCALTALGAVHCWGLNDVGQTSSTVGLGPDGALGPVAEIALGASHSCALTKGDDTVGVKTVKVRCWGKTGNPDTEAANCMVAEDGAVTCLVADLNGNPIPGSLDKTSGTGALGPVTQLAVGGSHSCVVTLTARALCWGDNTHGQALAPPDVQGQTEELGLGASHSCARTLSGQVRCWGDSTHGQTTPTVGLGQGGALGPATQLEVGNHHSCARVESGRLYCWGDLAMDISTLPPRVVVAVDAAGVCALLVDGSLYCPDDQELFPDELRSGEGVMSVLPRQLLFGERAAIRFAVLGETTEAFSARIEIFGDGTAELGSYYRLLDSDGQPLVAEENANSPLVAANSVIPTANSPGVAANSHLLTGNPPMAWLEPVVDGRSLFLYVRPLELQTADGLELSIRQAAQRVELTTTLARLRVSVPAGELLPPPAQGTDTVTVDVRVEAMDAMNMPVNSTGLLLVAEPTAGSVRYWSPSVARPAVLSATDEIGVFEGRLRIALDADNTAAELRIGVIGFQAQGIIVETAVVRVLQSLSFVAAASTTTEGADGVELQIGLPLGHVGRPVEIDLSLGGTALYDSDYTLVASETSGSVRFDETDSGVTLRLTDVPDTPLILLLRPRANDIIRQGDRRVELQLSGYRVTGDDERSADALPATLGVTILDRYLPVMQRLLDVASGAACVLLDEDNDDLVELRCWTVADAAAELRTVLDADDILSARQLAFGEQHVCWLQQDRQVVCDGGDSSGQATIPDDLSTTSTVAVAAGRVESCAVDEDGAVRCWGEQSAGLPADLRAVMQLSLGDGHGCALHADGVVSCWGDDTNDKATPPDNLAPVVQLALGYEHSCALQRDGQVSCWGGNMPPVDLGLATQLTSGAKHSCALLADGTVRCWGANDSDQLSVPSLPPGGVKSLVAGGNSSCALLADGSVRCWGSGLENAVPAGLQPDDVVVSVLPQRLLVGQRAAIRFADLRGDREAPAVRIELLDGTAKFGSDYRLLDAAGQPLSAAPDGRYLLAGDTQPAAYIESLLDPQELRTLYVLPLETVPAAGAAPSLRRAAQRVDLAAFVGRLVVQMHGGAERLLTADNMAPVRLRLLLTDIDGGPLNEFSVLTVRLQGMLSGDSMLVPAEPFEITASGIGVTTEIRVILDDSGETTLHFTVLDKPPGAVVDLSPTALRITLGLESFELDVTGNGRVGTDDLILLMRFVGVGSDSLSQRADAAEVQARLESLLAMDEMDFRLDLDGNGKIDVIDLRIILRHLAGLRGAALGEGVQSADVEALFQPNP